MLEQIPRYSSIIAGILLVIGICYFLITIEVLPWKYKGLDESRDSSTDIEQDHALEFALVGAKILTVLFVLLLITMGAVWNIVYFLKVLPCGIISILLLSLILFWRQRVFQRSYSKRNRYVTKTSNPRDQ